MGSRRHTRGSALVDYLLIIAVVSAVGVPLVMKYFGEPIQRTFQGNRQELVGFLAQNQKRPVPNAWFSREEPATPKEPGDISTGGDITVGNPKGPGNITVGNPKTPNVKGPGEITVGGGGTAGSGGQPGSGSGGPGSGGQGAARPGGAGSLPGGGDFFGDSKSGQEDDKKSADASTLIDEAAYGKANAGRRAGASGEEGASGSTRRGNQKSDSEKEDNRVGVDESGKKTTLQSDVKEHRRAGLSKPFDWWLLIKILLVLLIILFVAILAVGTARKK